MSDLISRQAAIEALAEHEKSNGHNYTLFVDIVSECAEIIRDLPPAEPERKTGKWIYGEHDVAMCDGYWCDKCGFFVPWDYKRKFIDFINDYHFCPSCGTKMEGNG